MSVCAFVKFQYHVLPQLKEQSLSLSWVQERTNTQHTKQLQCTLHSFCKSMKMYCRDEKLLLIINLTDS